VAITFTQTVPTLRIFSEEKGEEFYAGDFGFHADWDVFVFRSHAFLLRDCPR